MADKEIFEKLEAEIERLENYEIESVTSSDTRFGWIHGKTFALTSIRVLLDSMQKSPVSEDLEEAAEKCAYVPYPTDGNHIDCKKYGSFIEGAIWQEQQLMTKAIDAQCFGFQGDALFSFRLPADNYLVGSEVKVIVIKED